MSVYERRSRNVSPVGGSLASYLRLMLQQEPGQGLGLEQELEQGLGLEQELELGPGFDWTCSTGTGTLCGLEWGWVWGWVCGWSPSLLRRPIRTRCIIFGSLGSTLLFKVRRT